MEEGGKGGGGGGVEDTDCSGPDAVHRGYHTHHHHPTPAGLIRHLRECYRMMLARKLVDTYGYDLVVGVLDELTETYGAMLDAPKLNARKSSEWERPPPEIGNPAGFIFRMVQEAAVEMEHAADDVGQVDAASDAAHVRQRGTAKHPPRLRAINDDGEDP